MTELLVHLQHRGQRGLRSPILSRREEPEGAGCTQTGVQMRWQVTLLVGFIESGFDLGSQQISDVDGFRRLLCHGAHTVLSIFGGRSRTATGVTTATGHGSFNRGHIHRRDVRSWAHAASAKRPAWTSITGGQSDQWTVHHARPPGGPRWPFGLNAGLNSGSSSPPGVAIGRALDAVAAMAGSAGQRTSAEPMWDVVAATEDL